MELKDLTESYVLFISTLKFYSRERVRNIMSFSSVTSTSSFICSNVGGHGRSGIVIDLDLDLKKPNISVVVLQT